MLNRQFRSRKAAAAHQALWMTKFEQGVLAARPELAGRVDWYAAKYFYFAGKEADEAVRIHLA